MQVNPSQDAGDGTRWCALQDRFRAAFSGIFGNSNAPRTVVVLPSLSFDAGVMEKISAVQHYEERMLCMLLLLRLPGTRIVYITSTPIPDPIIAYYLGLLPGAAAANARERLSLLSCYDDSNDALTAKVLARPRLIQRVREAIPDPASAYIAFFTVGQAEKKLALELDLPIYGCDPDLSWWGSKSGSRRIFKEAGLTLPAGFEDLTNAEEIADALVELKAMRPDMRRAVVKLNEGFSGEGNAIFEFANAPGGSALKPWIMRSLPGLTFEATGMSWESFLGKFEAMHGTVEEFIEGGSKRSPSVQFRVNPLGEVEIVSTHDQVLGGENDQVFLGCTFPADGSYRLSIQEQGSHAARLLAGKGVLGRFSVDFLSIPSDESWRHYAIEVNLRKGGTTHPFVMLQHLTNGRYDSETGLFFTAAGEPRCYYATDNLQAAHYRGLTPPDLMDIAASHGLAFDAARQEGVVFHLIGALSQFGKLGVVSIADSQDRAQAAYRHAVQILDQESRRFAPSTPVST